MGVPEIAVCRPEPRHHGGLYGLSLTRDGMNGIIIESLGDAGASFIVELARQR